jgi:Ca2+-transporting ATPase
MSYIFSIHVPIAGLSLLPLFFNKELILFPIHIVFLELIIDPACSVVFEAEKEEADLLSRAPRNVKEPLFGRRNVIMSLLQGVGVLTVCTIMYLGGLYFGKNQLEGRTLAFTTLIIANIALILTNRSWSESFIQSFKEKNNAFFGVLVGAIIFMAFALFVPIGRELFKFSKLHPFDILYCFAAGLLSISWFEIYKYAGRRKNIIKFNN